MMRHLTFNVTDFNSQSTTMNEVLLEDDEVGGFTRKVAEDLAQNVPEIRHKGACVILYDDEDGNRLSIMPIDPLQ